MKAGSTKANYVYSIIYRLSICVLPLVVTPYIARTIDAAGNGVYVYTSTIACFFIMFGKLGLDNYGSRAIARIRDNKEEREKTFVSIYVLQLITSLASIAVYIALVAGFVTENKDIFWLQLMYVASALFDVSWYFYGTEQFKLTTIRSVLARLLIIAGVFLFVKTKDGLRYYTLVMSACFLAEQLMLMPFLIKQVRPVRITVRDVTRHIKPNTVLFVSVLAMNVYHWMDKIMLKVMADSASVAYYNYAESIVNLPKGIVQALGAIMLPRVSYMVIKKRLEDCKKLFYDSSELVLFICCALCFGIMGVSPVLVPLFLGPDYTPTILLTIELAIVMIPMSLTDAMQNQLLVPFGMDKALMRSMILGAGANILLNLLLIPLLGASGAVIGTLGAELTTCAYLLVSIRGMCRLGKLLRRIIPYAVFGVFEYLLATALGTLALNPFLLLLIQMLAAGGLYLALCLGYYMVRKRIDPGYLTPFTRIQRTAELGEGLKGGEAI